MQRLRRLTRRRSARSDEGAFVIEGPTLVREALQTATRTASTSTSASAAPPAIVVEEVLAEPGCPDDVLAAARHAGVAVRRVHAGHLARVVDTVTPQPVAAVARMPRVGVAAAVAAAGPVSLVLVGLSDPGNAGTLLRSAEAAGAGAVFFAAGSVDPFGPKCVRSSAGSVLRLAVVRDAPVDAVLDALRGAGIVTVATTTRGGVPYDRHDLSRPTAVVLGNEAHGLAEGLADAVDAVVTIPMVGPTESLNVAMAGTILCFESLRQRRRREAASGGRNELDDPPAEAAGCTPS